MITPTVHVNPADIERFSKILAKISNTLGKPMKDLCRQAMIFGLQSASKATKPGTSGTVKGLTDKYRYRPIVEITNAIDGWFWYISARGKIFRNKNDFGEKAMRRGINRITSFYELWSKKKNHWDWSPYFGSGNPHGYDKSSKVGRIPHAGAGKVGWYGALRGSAFEDTGDNRRSLSVLQERYTPTKAGISVTNLVDYIGKTSPNSAAVGLANAEKRLVHSYELKMKAIEGY